MARDLCMFVKPRLRDGIETWIEDVVTINKVDDKTIIIDKQGNVWTYGNTILLGFEVRYGY